MYQDTVTVFNRIKVDNQLYWKPYVLHNVDWNGDASAILARYGATSQDTSRLHIAYTITDGKMMIGDYEYVLPKAYSGAEGTISFIDGESFSFYWVGEWTETGDILDSDYPKGFYNYMRSVSDDIYAISSVARYSVIPHFEIMAR